MTDPLPRHPHAADARFDGGDLDCGNGLLLLIREHLDPLPRGGILEFTSTDPGVEADVPAWCRLTGNEFVSWTKSGGVRSFHVAKGALAERRSGPPVRAAAGATGLAVVPVHPPAVLPRPAPAPPVPALAAMGVGSWPRPRWAVSALHERLEGRMTEADFQATCDDAVRLAVAAQERAGVDVVTDGEQRRDSYANFVGGRLDNCRLIPLTDLLPLVDHPEELAAQFRSLDVPASEVRHPAVFGPLARSRPIAAHELAFLRTLTSRPTKVALPGPYVLSRVMWLECVSDRAYATREALADDVVRVLREEVHDLLAAGASLVQLDEPVLTEVVHGRLGTSRSFMCGALSSRGETARELDLAREWIDRVVEGLPRERLALHVCRGNWTPDESAALAGDYAPLVPLLSSLEVGTYVLEMATPRAGDVEVLRGLPDDRRVAVGVVNPKQPRVETPDEIVARARRAIDVLGRDRVLLVPDCGFATFADNPVATAAAAEAKLAAMAEASRRLRGA
jgi:5-methyltetrahydropteroyltriglutamate--homocysteine methyltransferase